MIPLNSRSILPAAVAAMALLLGGCSNLYQLEVESTRDAATQLKLDAVSYAVVRVSDTSAVDGGDLRRADATRIVREALAVRGMYQAPSVDAANVHLDIQFGVAPQKIEVHELTNPARGHSRTLVGKEVREKHLMVTARSADPPADGQPPAVLWTVHVRSKDDRDELRKYLPILAEVAADWASRNTHGVRSFTATLDDGVLVYVSGGHEQPGISPFLPE